MGFDFLIVWVPQFDEGVTCTITVSSGDVFTLEDETADFPGGETFGRGFAPGFELCEVYFAVFGHIIDRKLDLDESSLPAISNLTLRQITSQWEPLELR